MSPGVAQRYVHKDFPHSSHRALVELVGESPAKILDVGAATGYLGRALAGHGHTLVGVERDPQAAEMAAGAYARFHVADLAALPRLPEAPFDVIVAGDVLEHVPRPEETLARLVDQLAPGGRVLLSVPNVAFVLVRLSLLAGRFEYASRGIMDATHLRFFTRRSIVRALRAAGLVPVAMRGLPPPLPLVATAFAQWPLRVVYETAALLAWLWPALFAYQLVVEARR